MDTPLNQAIRHLVQYHWQARARVVEGVSQAHLSNRSNTDSSSAGFLLIHMAETSLYFLQQLILEKSDFIPRFGAKVTDRGQLVQWEEIQDIHLQGVRIIERALESYSDEDWLKQVPLLPFKPDGITKFAGLQIVMMHCQHHLGQVSLCLKHPIS